MSNKINIIGAGMAGLLAGAMLRDECGGIFETQPSLPNNHSALLRFKSSIVGDTLNIPFRKVKVMKSVLSTGNPVRDTIEYSIKTNGSISLRSVITAKGEIEERYIAPDDLIQRMSNKVSSPFHFGHDFNGKLHETSIGEPIISTLPMPILMKILGYENIPNFEYVYGVTATAQILDCDICATVYVPSKEFEAYRVSITGNRLIVEFSFPTLSMNGIKSKIERGDFKKEIFELLRGIGLPLHRISGDFEFKIQNYSKIVPIDDGERKRFMIWATDHFGIYSLGRFATWRPGLLLDDLVNDVRVIQRLIRGETSYGARK